MHIYSTELTMEGRDNEIGSSSPNRTHDDADNPQEGKHEPDGNEALDDGDSPISLPPIMPSEPIETMTTSRLMMASTWAS